MLSKKKRKNRLLNITIKTIKKGYKAHNMKNNKYQKVKRRGGRI